MMQLNVGSVDRFVRVFIGVLIFSLALVLPGQLKLISLLGLIPIFTAFFRWCPLYTLFGLSTCPLRTKK